MRRSARADMARIAHVLAGVTFPAAKWQLIMHAEDYGADATSRYRDVGTATLLRNSEVLYQWELRSIGANEFQGRVTPLPFQPSDNIVFQASCEAPGPTSATGCDVAVLIGGRLVPPA